jgi:hypothetical protein
MATDYLVLGQATSIAGVEVTLYTVPAETQAVVSSITIANRDVTNTTYRVAVRKNGETLANKQYIAYDIALDRNSTHAHKFGITLGAGDVLTVRSASANVSFSAFGTEITP